MPSKLINDAILNIDIYKWSTLKRMSSATRQDSQAEPQARERGKLAGFHDLVKSEVTNHRGQVWSKLGDCVIASGFPIIDEGVNAAISIQQRVEELNNSADHQAFPIAVRIGVSRGTLDFNVPLEARGEHDSDDLNEAGHLQKECPPGRIRISKDVFESLFYHRAAFRPALTSISDDQKALSADSFVWTERSYLPGDRTILRCLTEVQRRAYPPRYLTESFYRQVPYSKGFSAIATVLQESVVVLGETRAERSREYPAHHPATTGSAIGIIEVFACCGGSSKVEAAIDEWVDTVDMACDRNLIVIGSPTVNLYAHALNGVLPVGFVDKPTEPLRIRVGDGLPERFFPENVQHSDQDRHYGLVLLTYSPLNPEKDVLWIAGITGMGTQAAARLVRDLVHGPNALENLKRIAAPLKSKNHGEIAEPNVAIVRPKFGAGFGVHDYRLGGWRVANYEVEWVGKWPSTQLH